MLFKTLSSLKAKIHQAWSRNLLLFSNLAAACPLISTSARKGVFFFSYFKHVASYGTACLFHWGLRNKGHGLYWNIRFWCSTTWLTPAGPSWLAVTSTLYQWETWLPSVTIRLHIWSVADSVHSSFRIADLFFKQMIVKSYIIQLIHLTHTI